jgi:hypothetical protein
MVEAGRREIVETMQVLPREQQLYGPLDLGRDASRS